MFVTVFVFVLRCAVVTEFSRDVLAQRGVKVELEGEVKPVVVSLSGDGTEEKNGAVQFTETARAGEKCEVTTFQSHCQGLFQYFYVFSFI